MKIKNIFIILSLFKALICGVSSTNAIYNDVNNYVTGMGMEPILVSNDDQAIVVDGFTSASNANVNDVLIAGHSHNITTANNGPNLGIYVVNTQASTASIITNNRINVTGRAGDNKYNLVSGMELQDTYAEVSGNVIVVNNIGECTNSTYAFGISYCQNTTGPHTFYIEDNDVTVNNGNYAVYLYEEGSRGSVKNNGLIAIGNSTKEGNGAVNAPSDVEVKNNY